MSEESNTGEPASNIPSTVEFKGKTYKPLADGKYDVIILGTGLKECILSGLLSIKGKKVSNRVTIGRNDGYTEWNQRKIENHHRSIDVH